MRARVLSHPWWLLSSCEALHTLEIMLTRQRLSTVIGLYENPAHLVPLRLNILPPDFAACPDQSLIGQKKLDQVQK
ncbi:hypothetical protein PoB_005973500 [Plakobranchus ocellatus]|uniref:Uncharacterized protein n=1 Tax=Plakobranchus ocellatus TaxID=259542 RepID=A0AAV4CMB9_9GAST|nr:hypothetical protein PoB_005973500 [Plakobranchus ocellatus]